jgi:hypothetical protein
MLNYKNAFPFLVAIANESGKHDGFACTCGGDNESVFVLV